MAKRFHMEDVVRVDSDVHAVLGSDVTWVIVKDGDSATLIDTTSGRPSGCVPPTAFRC